MLNRIPLSRVAGYAIIVSLAVTASGRAQGGGGAGDGSGGGMGRRATPHAGQPPLVVMIVVDQMRGDYIDRFSPHLSADGLLRLARDGAHFPNAHFSHGTTSTGPGHACIATGANPRVHGISANADEHGECCDDGKSPLIGMGTASKAGACPERLLAATLGDMLKLSTGGNGKVVSVGLKDRSVILMGGHSPDQSVWWDLGTGRFVTSRYYTSALPAWAEELNRNNYAAGFFDKPWERALPPAAYANCAADDDPVEGDAYGLGRTFPHPVNGRQKEPSAAYYAALWATPAGNEIVFEMAARAMQAARLGSDETTDLLCMALSSYDVCGHLYGPDSHEILDMTVRLDRQLAAFLKRLDEAVGRSRYVVALTSDHGVAPSHTRVKALRLDAGGIVEKDIETHLNNAIRRKLTNSDDKARYIAEIELPWVHLDQKALAAARLDTDLVVRECMSELPRIPGIGWVYPSSALAGDTPPSDDEYSRLAWAAYHPQMAGEVFIGIKPYWHKVKPDQAASHGTFHGYDRHVPVVLYGPGIRPGRYLSPADPIDIARSLCVHIGIEPAATMHGRVLSECLDAKASGR